MNATAPVPGTQGNATILLDGPEVPYGLINLQNVGEYSLAIGALDMRGTLLQPHLFLTPGQSTAGFRPPANAVKIILVGEKEDTVGSDISGEAELEYDVPWYS